MSFGHEQLDVYLVAIEYVAWAYRLCEELHGHRNAKDQLLRASQAIALNIAEGNGKATGGDRHRYFDIARGSALECGARLSQKHAKAAKPKPAEDVLEACGAISPQAQAEGKQLLDRIVAMLTRVGRRGYPVSKEILAYRTQAIDPDPDADSDPDRA